jgi:hypothetical protein
MAKKWMGTPPSKCDVCRADIKEIFIDGNMKVGSWANMCFSCHKQHGVGLGTGRGQKYRKQSDGTFLCMEGSSLP